MCEIYWDQKYLRLLRPELYLSNVLYDVTHLHSDLHSLSVAIISGFSEFLSQYSESVVATDYFYGILLCAILCLYSKLLF